MSWLKKIIKQYRCKKIIHKEGNYEVLGHNFTERVQWKVFSYADKEANIPRYWKVVDKCKYCGKKKTLYCHNLRRIEGYSSGYKRLVR